MTALTKEVVVTTSAAEITRVGFLPVTEILNLGPNSIWVAFGDIAACVINKCREVKSGEAWSFSLPTNVAVYALCSVLQVSGAATIVTQSQDGRLA